MERERWLEIKKILSACIDAGPGRRASFAREACRGNPTLLNEVETLLASHASLGNFLEASVWDKQREELASGSRVGSYEIRESIARGGMGTVYRAVRAADYEKQVALKVVKRGMDSHFILQRFRHERQILAALDHPHIAKLLDGGTTGDGVPFLVMEYIEGRPITEYCEAEGLQISERLQLFRKVCSAVHYAHQNLVVHRDLKPANILVTSGGEPKLLDFGIAKLLEPDADTTVTSMRLMTPECASPEQVRGEPITTAADIYALGVLLYQLLGGEPPYHFVTRSVEEIRRIVCETEFRKPSTLRALPSDLDTIVLKAMHKEPARRYSSAEQLSEDIERHLLGLPVRARADTLRYRVSKFLARHTATSVAAALFLISLSVGMVATLWQAHLSAAQRRKAEQRFKDVRGLATSNLFELNDALQKLPASAAARHLLIQRALEYLDKLRSDGPDDSELMHEVAVGYERIAQLEGRFTGKDVGDVNASLSSYRKALAIRSALIDRSRGDPVEIQGEMNLLRPFIASSLLFGNTEEALRCARLRQGLALQLVKRHPDDPQALIGQADSDLTLAWVLGGIGGSSNTREFGPAIAMDRAAIEILSRLHVPEGPLTRMALGARSSLALHEWKSGDFQEGLRTLKDLFSPQAARSLGPDAMLALYNCRANILVRLGEHGNALRDYREGRRLAIAAAEREPDDLNARLEVEILSGLAATEDARLGNPRRALAAINLRIQNVESMFQSKPESFYRRIFLVGYSLRAEVLSSLGDQPGARTDLSHSLAIAERLAREDPLDMESRLQIASAHAALGVIWARCARFAMARSELSDALTRAKQLLAVRPTDRAGLDLTMAMERDLAAVSRCVDDKPCRSVNQFRLPSLVD